MKFIEWLAGEKAQQMHADLNYEYPMRAGVPINHDHRGLRQAQAPTRCRSPRSPSKQEGGGDLVDKVGFDN